MIIIFNTNNFKCVDATDSNNRIILEVDDDIRNTTLKIKNIYLYPTGSTGSTGSTESTYSIWNQDNIITVSQFDRTKPLNPMKPINTSMRRLIEWHTTRPADNSLFRYKPLWDSSGRYFIYSI